MLVINMISSDVKSRWSSLNSSSSVHVIVSFINLIIIASLVLIQTTISIRHMHALIELVHPLCMLSVKKNLLSFDHLPSLLFKLELLSVVWILYLLVLFAVVLGVQGLVEVNTSIIGLVVLSSDFIVKSVLFVSDGFVLVFSVLVDEVAVKGVSHVHGVVEIIHSLSVALTCADV